MNHDVFVEIITFLPIFEAIHCDDDYVILDPFVRFKSPHLAL
jgi:hypothetical protein